MPEIELKDRILYAAVGLFCKNGFHGTSMREIAEEANCSLPMMYYYYKNKSELYEEIAVNQFFALMARLNAELDLQQHPVELYLQVARQRSSLNAYDSAVMKIAYRLWYGFEGMEELRGKITHWEKDRVANSRRMLDPYVGRECDRQPFAEVFTGFLESVVTKIILLDEQIPMETLRTQLTFLLDKVK